MKAWDTDIGSWVCVVCGNPYDPTCERCEGNGDYFDPMQLETYHKLDLEKVDCNCCGCELNFSI